MQTEKLQRAIGAIHVRFCDQALRRADGLPPTQPWPIGQLRADRLCGTGGLPFRPDQRRRRLPAPGGDRCAEEVDAALERLRARLGLSPSRLPEQRLVRTPA